MFFDICKKSHCSLNGNCIISIGCFGREIFFHMNYLIWGKSGSHLPVLRTDFCSGTAPVVLGNCTVLEIKPGPPTCVLQHYELIIFPALYLAQVGTVILSICMR